MITHGEDVQPDKIDFLKERLENVRCDMQQLDKKARSISKRELSLEDSLRLPEIYAMSLSNALDETSDIVMKGMM